jgi:hypothetical protein
MRFGIHGGARTRPLARKPSSALFPAILCLVPFGAAQAQSTASGYQVINGTEVYTVVDMAAGHATFSNHCGSQRVSQSDLQRGAIPDRIIPCPRGAAGLAPTMPSAPRGRDSLAIGLAILEAAPAMAAIVESLTPPAGDGAAYTAPAPAPAPAPPPAVTEPPRYRETYHDRPAATAVERDGYDRARPVPPGASRPSSSQARNVAVMQFEEAAESNRDRKYCEAKDLFEQAASSFARAGDADRANDARFQASLTAADCVDEKRRKEDDKFAIWCMNDDEDMYAGGWRPEPGAGCDPSKKPVTTGALPQDQKAKTAQPMRETLRRRIAEQRRAEEAVEEAKRAAEAAAPDMSSLDETRAPPPAATSASDDFRNNLPGGQP